MNWLVALLLFSAWEKVADRDGVLVERLPKEAGLFEIRATIHTELSPEAFFEMLWRHEEYPAFVPHLKMLKILSESSNEKLIYEQLQVPIIADRDYSVRVWRESDPDTRMLQLHFETANERGPPTANGHVRINRIRGGWTAEPSGSGSDLTYWVYADPGGGIPRWLVNAAQKDATRDYVLAMVNRAKKDLARTIGEGSSQQKPRE